MMGGKEAEVRKFYELINDPRTTDVSIDDGYLSWLRAQFEFLVKKEQYGHYYVDGAPSWVSWWLLKTTGKINHAGFSHEANSDVLKLRDAGAIAPTNLTMTQVLQFETHSPALVRHRFKTVMIALTKSHKQKMEPTMAVQFGAIAALPTPIHDDRTHRDLWVGYAPSKYWNGRIEQWGTPACFRFVRAGNSVRVCI